MVQLEGAGSNIRSAEQTITDKEKVELLQYLRRNHGLSSELPGVAEPKKITLKRRTVSELRQSGPQGKAKTVNVEVRRHRTYVKRSVAMADDMARLETQLAERAREEEEAQARLAEAQRREEEENAASKKRRARRGPPFAGGRRGPSRRARGRSPPCRGAGH